MILIIAGIVFIAALAAVLAARSHRKKVPAGFDELLPLLYPDGVELSQEEILSIMHDNSPPPVYNFYYGSQT